MAENTEVKRIPLEEIYRTPLETLLLDAVTLLLERHEWVAQTEWGIVHFTELERILVALRAMKMVQS